MKPLLLCFWVLAATAVAEESVEARVRRGIEALDSDDPAERHAAVEAIAREGAAAEPLVREALKSPPSEEARALMVRTLEGIRLVELKKIRFERRWTREAAGEHVAAFAVSADGRRVATAGEDGRVVVRDAGTLEVVRTFRRARGTVPGGVILSRDGDVVVAIDREVATAWEVPGGRELEFACGSIPGGLVEFDGGVMVTLDWVGFLGDGLAPSSLAARQRDRVFARVAMEPIHDGEVRFAATDLSAGGARATVDLGAGVSRAPHTWSLDGSQGELCYLAGGVAHLRSARKEDVPRAFGVDLTAVAWLDGAWVTLDAKGGVTWWGKDGKLRSLDVEVAGGSLAAAAGGIACFARAGDAKEATADRIAFLSSKGEVVLDEPGRLEYAGPHVAVFRGTGTDLAVVSAAGLNRRPQVPADGTYWDSATRDSAGAAWRLVDHRLRRWRCADTAPVDLETGHRPALRRADWIPAGIVAHGHGSATVHAPTDGADLPSPAPAGWILGPGIARPAPPGTPAAAARTVSADGSAAVIEINRRLRFIGKADDLLFEAPSILPADAPADLALQYVVFTPDGRWLLAGVWEGLNLSLQLWDVRGRRRAWDHAFPAEPGRTWVHLGDQGTTAIPTDPRDRDSVTLRVISTDGRELAVVPDAARSSAAWTAGTAVFVRNGAALLSLRSATALQITDFGGEPPEAVPLEIELTELESAPRGVGLRRLSAAGREDGALLVYRGGRVRRIDRNGFPAPGEAHGVSVEAEEFCDQAPDGLLALLTRDAVEIRDGRTFELLASLPVVNAAAVRWSPDGKMLAVIHQSSLAVWARR